MAEARKQARKFAPAAEADDLFGAAQEKFPHALRSWNPKRSSFFNYFWTAATRAMVEHATKEVARQNVRGLNGPELDERKDTAPAAREENPDVQVLQQAIERLPLGEQLIFNALEGRGVKPQTETGIARTLRAEAEQIAALRDAIRRKLARQVENGKRPGRPSDDRVRIVVALAARLRREKKTWPEIVQHLWNHYSVKYTPCGLRSTVKRKTGHN